MVQRIQPTSAIRIEGGKIYCPHCGRPTDRRVRPDTRAENLPLWCKKCHRESIINITGATILPE